MEAKEKAIELFDKFYLIEDSNNIASMREDNAKQCALICVEEIIICLNQTEAIQQSPVGVWKAQEYWYTVKQELLKL